MVDLDKRNIHDDIARFLDGHLQGKHEEEITPEMKQANDNLDFERHVLEQPVPAGIGAVPVFGVETWDINAILKGNYWGRTIYTTDKICKLFLKWNLERQKKYLMKKKGLDFNYAWLLLLVMGGIVALLVILFVLPQMGL